MAWASPTTDRRGVDPGRASHAGANPEGGRNALYEMAHQMLKSRQFGDDSKGLKINWTVANAGATRNVIPASDTAIADVRSLNNDDLDRMEAALRESIKERLIPGTKIELDFYRSRPAFVANNVSRVLAAHAQAVFKEIGKTLDVRDRATGGGTDAALAGLRPRGVELVIAGDRARPGDQSSVRSRQISGNSTTSSILRR